MLQSRICESVESLDISLLWIRNKSDFCIVSNEGNEKNSPGCGIGFWRNTYETHSVIRFATSWATTMEDTHKLSSIAG